MTYRARALLLDVSLIVLVVVGIYLLRISLEPDFIPLRYPIPTLLLLLAIWVSVMHIEGAYSPRILGSGVQEFKVVTGASFKGFLLVCLLGLATNQHPPRINLFLGWFGSVVLVSFGRKFLQTIMHRKRRSGSDLRNVLILGSTEYAAELESQLARETHIGLRVSAHIPVKSSDSDVFEDEWLSAIDRSIIDGDVDEIIIEDAQDASPGLLGTLSWHINKHNIDMLVAPTFLQQFGPRLEVKKHPQLPLIYVGEPTLSLSDSLTKRLFDILFSVISLVALSPILIATAIGILFSNFGPIFFTQERIGHNGKAFKILKFRSMVVDAQSHQDSIWESASDDGTNNKAKNDPRITPIGRVIRKFSIDELPQLLNVLKGDMSIVGPRPIQEVELNVLQNQDLRRHLIKPGLTGLWQISGRSDTTWQKRIQMDLDYLHNWSLGLDIAIILRTFRVVASGEGAY